MRALARWGWTPLLAAPVGAWGLGLGDIELQSALNQPFQAEISLVSATPDELQGLKIALAAPATFARYGLDRPQFLSALEFRVVTDRNGRGLVRVTSRQSIAEPFVTLLIEATWPRGRLLREYTVLLDPPVLLPAPTAPAPVQPAQTRAPTPSAPGGPIDRPEPAPAPRPQQRVEPPAAPRPEPAPPVSSTSRTSPEPTPRAPAVAPGGAYGPVQRAETLWSIATRYRPEDVSINQMMIAIFQANPEAFGGNINFLREGATLRLPTSADFNTLAASAADEEVRRQEAAWAERRASGPELRLLPPAESAVARVPSPAPAPAPSAGSSPGATPSPDATAAAAAAEESRRLVELQNEELQRLREQSAAPPPTEAPAPAPAPGEPGVDLEQSEQIFAEETPEEAPAEPEPALVEPTPAPAPAPAPTAAQPSLLSQIMGWVASPFLWIGLGVAALLLTALWFMRRRREEPQDVTGRWEALEAEVDDDEVREATERMRRQLPEETIVVEEQGLARLEPADEPQPPTRRQAAQRAAPRAAAPEPLAGDETLSSQTVINLDQADPVAEADFHMAYGLYDQAAELVQKALDAEPKRRDLKLKLLEVYFVWGNKDAFRKAAQSLRQEIGDGADPDWDKVVIMGRQICPDEQLFTSATTGGASVDVDLEAGDSPLDLAFEEAAGAADVPGDLGLDFNLEASDERPAPPPKPKKSAPKTPRDFSDSSLDIGERTAAGLEAALFDPNADDDEVTGTRTTPDLTIDDDSMAVTQESPTIERPGDRDWANTQSATMRLADSPTVETPTIETETVATSGRTVETPTIETPAGNESPTVERPALGGQGDFTAEIDLDDLGLDVKDMEELPSDLGELPMAADRETDTREQPALETEDELLSATGVTQVLHGAEEQIDDEEATMLAPGFSEGTLTGTEVLEGRFDAEEESGSTSLVQTLETDESLDLNLSDLTQALHGADTVEQPRASSFSHDVFGGGDTPVDLDIGADFGGGDDEPTGTEEASSIDPQTMTEVGTKLDLARAYIDMGDPEGARSILEEVLDEGDPNQRREAQSLIDVLTA